MSEAIARAVAEATKIVIPNYGGAFGREDAQWIRNQGRWSCHEMTNVQLECTR